jgi:hypothetical protein
LDAASEFQIAGQTLALKLGLEQAGGGDGDRSLGAEGR